MQRNEPLTTTIHQYEQHVTRRSSPTRRIFIASGLLLAVLFVALLPTEGCCATSPHATRVLLISIDGLSFPLFEDPTLEMPTLRKLAQRGIRGPLAPIFPTMTWPTHTTMITGNLPRRHGVTGNRHYDRKKRRVEPAWRVARSELIRTPTIFDQLKKAGIDSASIQWPGTQSDPSIRWNIPEVYGRKAYQNASTQSWLKELRKAGIPTEWLSHFSKREMFLQDASTCAIARYAVRQHRPRMLALHFLAADTLGHLYGPGSAPMRWALRLIDGYLAQVLAEYEQAGILDETEIVIVSDHGFIEVKTSFDLDKLLVELGLVENKRRPERGPVYSLSQGQVAFVHFLDAKKRDEQRRKLVAALRKRPEIERIVGPSGFAKLGLPSWGDTRIGELVVIGKPDVIFRAVKEKEKLTGRAGLRGMHGYPGSHETNKALLIAVGPSFRRSTLPTPVSQLDVAPLILKLFGLAFEKPIDGKPPTQLLATKKR